MFKYIFVILLLSVSSKSCNQESNQEENTNQAVEKSSSINNINRLHDIWALTDIKGEAINKENFSAGVPTLEIFVADKRIGGFSGCNNYFASIDSLNENEFILGPIASTKKYCMGVDEKSFFTEMNKVQRYQLEKMRLDLFEGDSLLLSFKKVD